ncbi:LCP family protein [Virgibacillus sp. 179-BFC.A HS]|uniref:Regulatory protein MsrR n=1 Tax=Tigheibacillus jepli TaxID=3035914 RepID=A0ABU5CIB8_9BACI|nr:LCP family protein [Virgibacillus sp. 179-BFC.A HS]MDY0406065.1 LCP family protein [Virgibacillus sp. 179-BFC.A HS]
MKKGKIVFTVVIIFFILLTAAGIYSYITYEQGRKEGEKDVRPSDQEQLPFQEKEVEFGEIKVLLIGNDARKSGHGRSDTLMIAYYNQHTEQVKIASIMRDSYLNVAGHGMQKINAAFAFGGPELLRQTIQNNFGIDVNYYAIIDFRGFPKLVDLIAPDGIEVDVKEKMSSGIGMTLYPGKQVLHGKELLGYVRFRHDAMSDFGRVNRQQEVLSKLKDQAMQLHSMVKLPKIMGLAQSYVETNLDTATMMSIGKGLLTNSKKLETLRIPVDGSFTNDRTEQGAVLRIDLDKNSEALQAFFKEGTKEN